MALSSDKSKFTSKVNDFLQLISQNNIKSLKKLMRTKIGKSVKIIQNGLFFALSKNNGEALKILLTSPLSDLCGEINFYLHYAVIGSNLGAVKILLADKRFDVNQIARECGSLNFGAGMTPLMVACKFGKPEMVKKLLEHPDINVNADDDVGREKEWSSLEYAVDFTWMYNSDAIGIEIIQLLLNHRDVSHSLIQNMLSRCLFIASLGDEKSDWSVRLKILNILLKKNFETGYKLNRLFLQKSEFHEYYQNLIVEEHEMKLREEYYKGNFEIYAESLGNRAYGISVDVLLASILKCKCSECLDIKTWKKIMYSCKGPDEQPKQFFPSLAKEGMSVKCIVNLNRIHKTRRFQLKCEEFLEIEIPVFKHILFHGGFEKNIEEVINGKKLIAELHEDLHNNNSSKKDPKENNVKGTDTDSSISKKSVNDFHTLCWACSDTQAKLYKCGGCRKARYCSDQCIANDWEEHMNYCKAIQEKRNRKKMIDCDSSL